MVSDGRCNLSVCSQQILWKLLMHALRFLVSIWAGRCAPGRVPWAAYRRRKNSGMEFQPWMCHHERREASWSEDGWGPLQVNAQTHEELIIKRRMANIGCCLIKYWRPGASVHGRENCSINSLHPLHREEIFRLPNSSRALIHLSLCRHTRSLL